MGSLGRLEFGGSLPDEPPVWPLERLQGPADSRSPGMLCCFGTEHPLEVRGFEAAGTVTSNRSPETSFDL